MDAISEDCEAEGASYAAPLLMTKRLLLGAPRPGHVGQIVALANNKRVAHMLATMPHPYDDRTALQWIETSRRSSEPIPRRFAVFLRAHPETVIGACGIGSFDEAGEIHLGYWIGEPHWGMGYATEAAQTVVDFAFEVTNLQTITCACRVTNPASRRVIEKCGFQYRDMMMFHSLGAGGRVAAQRYALDRNTWQSLKAWARN
jgi:RimJ/RimL family protein N-acetyltransferase